MKTMKINIIGNLKNNSSKHVSKIPEGAQFCRLNPTGEFVELYYKIVEDKYNDGTTGERLQYYSFNFNNWSYSNQRDEEKFLHEKEFYSVNS